MPPLFFPCNNNFGELKIKMSGIDPLHLEKILNRLYKEGLEQGIGTEPLEKIVANLRSEMMELE